MPFVDFCFLLIILFVALLSVAYFDPSQAHSRLEVVKGGEEILTEEGDTQGRVASITPAGKPSPAAAVRPLGQEITASAATEQALRQKLRAQEQDKRRLLSQTEKQLSARKTMQGQLETQARSLEKLLQGQGAFKEQSRALEKELTALRNEVKTLKQRVAELEQERERLSRELEKERQTNSIFLPGGP